MPIYLILGCEIAFFSFLIGTYMHSFTFGLAILGVSSIIIYALFQSLYNLRPFVWGATLLAGLTTLLWASYIDRWLGTNFIAILFSILSGSLCYVLNDRFLKKYQL